MQTCDVEMNKNWSVLKSAILSSSFYFLEPVAVFLFLLMVCLALIICIFACLQT